MANGPFTLTEQQVALRLGVPTRWVATRRVGFEPHWSRGDAGRFLWSEDGAAHLAGLLDSETPKTAQDGPDGKTAVVNHPEDQRPLPEAPAHGKSENTAPSDDRVRLLVRRAGWKNRRVLHAVVVGDSEATLVTVWVQNSARFAHGLEILGRPWPGRPGVYTFAGNPAAPDAGPREPRRKGGW